MGYSTQENMAGEEEIVKALVVSYLSENDKKLADQVKKKLNPPSLPQGSPSVKEIVHHFLKTSPDKRRLSLDQPGSPSSKKKKKDSSSSEESSSEEDEPPKAGLVNGKGPSAKALVNGKKD